MKLTKKLFIFRNSARKIGAALVVTLALVVLVTMLLLAFFVNSTLNSQLEVSSTGRIETDLLARGSLELIVGDLKREMLSGSLASSATDNLLQPVTNASQVPYRVLSDSSMVSLSKFDNLIKQSVEGESFFPSTAPYGQGGVLPNISGASSISTVLSAPNNRKISLARWNEPRLLGDDGFSASNQAPHWIYLGREGLTNATGSNVVGRFAYNIYNVGGLININIAGNPTSLSDADRLALKGTPAGAILQGLIPGVLDAGTLVSWRNANTGASGDSYTMSILSDSNGFREPAPGDNRFISRQDLLRYARLNSDVLATNALPYLTVFSLERNSPSWGPMTNAVGASYQYLANANNTVSTNRLLPRLRRSVDGIVNAYDLNGSPLAPRVIKAGDPLVAKRFPLDRLKWITATGPLNGVSAGAIRDLFGLQWDTAQNVWIYSDGGAIKTLEEVSGSTPAREPNFFELLKATILSGSLGMQTRDGLSEIAAFDANSDYQIIQIGCNIIDQFRADDFPTRIQFDSSEYGTMAGVVDLPYLNKMVNLFYRPEAGFATSVGPQTADRLFIGLWLVPEFWSPHVRSAYSTNSGSYDIRFTANGSFSFGSQATDGLPEFGGLPPTAVVKSLTSDAVNLPGVNGNSFRSRPNIVRISEFPNANVSGSYGNVTDSGGFGAFVGLNVGFMDAYAQTNRGFLVANRRLAMRGASMRPVGSTNSLTLEVLVGSEWQRYDVAKNFRSATSGNMGLSLRANNTASGQGVGSPEFNNLYSMPSDLFTAIRGAPSFSGNSLLQAVPISSVGRADPRTDRFGLSSFASTQLGWLKATLSTLSPGRYFDNATLPRATSYDPTGYVSADGGLRAYQDGTGQFTGPGWPNTARAASPYFPGNYPGALTDNTPSATAGVVYYVDNDGIQRRALGAYETYMMNDTTRAPIMLNRRFFSVGDLGFVHRGEPWKNLDFFTRESADAGLLDVFTISDHGEVTEGKIDLNNAPAEVLAAYINGAVLNEATSGSFESAASAHSIATQIREEAKASPFLNKSELVTRFADNSALRSLLSDDKARHEVYVRGLSDVVQTRTWNLMIDVIAQKGRIPTGKDLSGFVVEGEQRYWLHVAIDRVTGEILDRRLEAVNE